MLFIPFSESTLLITGRGREAYYDDDHGDLYVRLPERTLVIGIPHRARNYSREQVVPALARLAIARLAPPAAGRQPQ